MTEFDVAWGRLPDGAALALRLLGWSAQRTLQDMCVDTWRWQSNNPEGYTGPGPDAGHTTQLKRN